MARIFSLPACHLVALATCLLLTAVITATTQDLEAAAEGRLAQRGIVVPKRSSLIISLNQQFNRRQQATSKVPPNSTSSLSNSTSTTTEASSDLPPQPALNSDEPAAPRPFAGVSLPAWLRRPSKKPQQPHQENQQLASLYLDRHQQQLLAANPNLLEAANLSLSAGALNLSALLTRSDLQQQLHSLQLANQNDSTANQLKGDTLASSQPAPASGQQQQLYRGHSLIELEVRSEQDRRYIRALYGNLSAAINEQAATQRDQQQQQQQPKLSVSPYVDVDFWSFRYAINDRVDIMVSPKARAFLLGQLARAKIRHRIKIDDVQARLDQQQQSQSPQPSGQWQLAAGANGGGQKESSLSGRQGGGASLGADGQAPIGNSSTNQQQQFFDNYQRLAEINQFLEGLVERNREVAQVKVIGRSSQGRYLRVLKLGYEQQDAEGQASAAMAATAAAADAGSANGLLDGPPPPTSNASLILEGFFRRQESTKKLGSIWLDGGTHAREWISPATVLYLAHRLADNHQRCQRFFHHMRQLVQQQAATESLLLELQQQQQLQRQRQARQVTSPRFPSASPSLEPELLSGINDINSSLLGQPAELLTRQRSEFERTMEALVKNPQQVAQEQGDGCQLELDQLLRRYTFYIMPVLNPDGYEYSHTHNRLWRKTRSVSQHPIYRHFCLGADPNRNYDARHGATGSSSHPCSQTFAGSVPFTEPETRHQSNFVYANRHSMKMYISFHSYSQMILLPLSHSRQLAPDHKDLESVGQAAVRAIERTHGTVYKVGPSASILYTASGTASDWAYEKAGIKYSYTVELRDTGTYGFLLPRQQIVPTGEETYNGLLAMIEQMEKNDNLLTSKSQVGGQADLVVLAGPTQQINSTSDAPAYERLQQPRPPLENIIDGSLTWAAPERGPWGVRDRKPVNTNSPPVAVAARQTPDERPAPQVVANSATGNEAELELAAAPHAPSSSHLDQDHHSHNHDLEPDAGYAFEGEGELMEPTQLQQLHRAGELRLMGRRLDHFRRPPPVVNLSSALTSTGRNSINSPSLSQRRTTPKPRRESSERLKERS